MEAQNSLQDRLSALGTSDPEEFRLFLRRLRKLFPEQAAEAYLLYIASNGLNAASQSMAFWLSGDNTYVKILLDPDSLTPELASKAIAIVKEIDQQFLSKFVKATAELTAPALVLRALGLLTALVDYSAFLPWLRSLQQSPDIRVRSRSSKLLCELRPNRRVVEQQMQSNDARIRSNAIEALWRSRSEDARELFRSALQDSSHRVVSNALVGLYLCGETDALNDMIELCAHKNHVFRAAAAWSIGYVKDARGIPALRELTRDPSLVVRKRALASLLVLESLTPIETETPVTPVEAVALEEDVPAEETSAPATDFSFSMFK